MPARQPAFVRDLVMAILSGLSARPSRHPPPKSARISAILDRFAAVPPFTNGMMAYAALMELVNEHEDTIWGADYLRTCGYTL